LNICIVGHGPSLKGRLMGMIIDTHQIVVRLKGCRTVLGTDDYGSRVDHLCASTEIMGTFFDVPAGSFWAYPKKGDYDFDRAVRTIMDLGAPVMIPLKLCNHWNEEFRKMGGKHPNVSTGMASIIIAAHYYEPKTINLAGFDTLLDPTKEFTRNDEIPRSGFGKIDHDWFTEHALLDKIREAYGCEIKSLC
jgi:hypothetical protein